MIKIATLGNIHDEGLKILRESNYEIVDISDFSIGNLKKCLTEVDAIAIRTAKLTGDILETCNSLKVVSRHGVGFDNVDLDYLNQNKIALAITGSSNAMTVSEHVITMFLNLCKQSKLADQLVREGNFRERNFMKETLEIYKKNILILGFGRIGKELAKRCKGFESQIYVCDPYIKSKEITDLKCIPVSFSKGIKIADFISIHLPLNKETEYLFSKKEFIQMKKNCILVNTSRGGIIKEDDLIWALNNQIIHSAGLDVFEKEPPEINNPLFKIKNLILSPHNAALTSECKKRMGVETCNNIVNFLEKKPELNLYNIINKNKLNLS